MKLSIVVPVYNVAQYLPKCLDSLLYQDLNKEDYEIIVVNDGSNDGSEKIAKEYTKRYSNIILINQENQGLSGARNSGIKVAKGKYIQFVDSDDSVQPLMEKALVEKMEEENLDVLRFNYHNVNDRYEVFEPHKSGKPYFDYRDEICDGLTFLNERLGYACYVWQFILKSELVKSCKPFKEGIYFEDLEWTPRILVIAQRVTSVDKMVYNYFYRIGSITNGGTTEKKKKIIEDKFILIESLKNQMQVVHDNRWYYGMISGTVISILVCVAEDFYLERKTYIARLKLAGVFPISDYHLNQRALRKRFLINISPFLFCWLLKVKNHSK